MNVMNIQKKSLIHNTIRIIPKRSVSTERPA